MLLNQEETELRPRKIVDLSMTINPTNPSWGKDSQWKADIREALFRIKPYIFSYDGCLVEDIEMWSHRAGHRRG